jgi:hypothetical protein
LPRNGSGTYTTPNSFSAGSTIASAQVNANFTDVGSEITGSLPTNGEKGMSGQFKGASGTVLLPGIAFGADNDCGFYRIGADNVGLAIGGVKVLDISSTGVAITGQLTTTNGPIPSGTKMLFYADSAPTGWTIFTTSINDKALRVVSGSGAGGGTGGATGGTTAFTSVFAARTIAANQLPNITLTVTDPGHTHTGGVGASTLSFAAGGANTTPTNNTSIGSAVTGISVAIDNAARGSVAQQTIDFAVTYASVIIATKD